MFTDSREHQVFVDSQVHREHQVLMDSKVRGEPKGILDQLVCQEHVVTLEDKDPKDPKGFLGQMHIKDFKVRHVPKGSKGSRGFRGFRGSKECKGSRGSKGCEPEGSSIQPALFNDGPSSSMKPTCLCSHALSSTQITLSCRCFCVHLSTIEGS